MVSEGVRNYPAIPTSEAPHVTFKYSLSDTLLTPSLSVYVFNTE